MWSRQVLPACTLTVLTTSQAMLVEAAKASHSGKIPYDTSAAVFLTELLKLCIAFTSWSCQRRTLEYSGLENFVCLSANTFAYAVPATLFIVQNNLVFWALSLLDPPTFQLWACFKIIPVGILARIMLGQHRSNVQWAALIILALGMATTTISEQKSTASENAEVAKTNSAKVWMGIVVVIFNGCLSALSSIVNEWLIKFSDPRAPLMFKNFQIYLWGSLVSAGYSIYHAESAGVWLSLLPRTITGSAYGAAIIVNNAAVGLCVSAVIKYADNLTKGFSTSAAVLLASAASTISFGYVPSRPFLIGSSVACSAFYLYFGAHNSVLLQQTESLESEEEASSELQKLSDHESCGERSPLQSQRV
mmetsp:Transcript_20573/g.57833  ORF Transcript_20573/g.57833 Transcript_20573/m.57833 type:complete len:362 (+) Transcript_20573:29-1114(+)